MMAAEYDLDTSDGSGESEAEHSDEEQDAGAEDLTQVRGY